LAARFCAKEATFKAIGNRIPWKNIEITSLPSGKPTIDIPHKRAIVSLSHTNIYATAVVFIWDD
jgi:phosphopantetheinyl transferase (holo-ACP synthase)